MKFAAFALVAFASSVAALPEGFTEQCCAPLIAGGGTSKVDLTIPLPDPDTYKDDMSQQGISGYSYGPCITDGETLIDSTECATNEEVCWYFTYAGGNRATGVKSGNVPDGSSGLLCCPADDPQCEDGAEEQDNPWTCATLIGWEADFIGEPGPDATDKGLYCGRTNVCKGTGFVCGDPHFQTWEGEWYDFHGECDLHFLEVPEFGKGLGLTIDIRTKARYEYSYVEAAAVRIGDDVLEVTAYGQYLFNGVENADLKGAKMAGLFEIEHVIRDQQHYIFNIYTGVERDGKAEAIQIKTFKDLVAVKMDNAYASTFHTARGMMGDFNEGKMLARDGKTIISDPVEFGMEWQVQAGEANLFATPSPINGKCVMPSKTASAERRRLGETVPLEAAVAACEAVDTVHHENCVYDVMATGDLEIAHAGVF